jgi:hypothetical protein
VTAASRREPTTIARASRWSAIEASVPPDRLRRGSGAPGRSAQACRARRAGLGHARRLAGLRRGHHRGVTRQVRHLPGDAATVIAATPGSHTVTTSSGP